MKYLYLSSAGLIVFLKPPQDLKQLLHLMCSVKREGLLGSLRKIQLMFENKEGPFWFFGVMIIIFGITYHQVDFNLKMWDHLNFKFTYLDNIVCFESLEIFSYKQWL